MLERSGSLTCRYEKAAPPPPLVIAISCVTQNLVRKFNETSSLKVEMLENALTLAPTLKFCLLDLDLRGVGGLNIEASLALGGPGTQILPQLIIPIVHHFLDL
ncbi:3401_t:CDS:2 [Ambispora gerdemannii]|uniref:3401_t:CDS:1 n=1 Tax=Ambispora gerdemannii TaxID=144530 RepID=A0A9N8YRC9_9GLOM|nr:3401_t:CDS:2 [Ambispora gerdemannii]